ncbi:DUF4446 family protein [Kribbella pratensis]|uniref:Uncharacterized protein DUF4446 n=1 Tax=Kribbella pratensis TaxID=2512112 RepID=A0A4R8C5J8_9ACTN|nr:DUF4446 family protein [Kribbella pratensis]TDW71182.1 uncharacterized protein DUF4446 [Kribbella pratensis]
MSSTLAGAFGVAALFVAVLALVFAIQALRARTDTSSAPAPLPEPEPAPEPEPKPGTVKSELRKLGKELAVTRAELKDTLQHLAVVRYDAFGETGGKLSWSMAILDNNGDGVVLTSINSRADARTYAKEIKSFTSESKLSPEEEEAIDTLHKESGPTVN